MSNIPEEVYLEILYRVPVETTFVCKCVCKSWLSLISTPDFVKTHLDFTIKKNNPKVIIKYSSGNYDAYSGSYDSLSSSSRIYYFEDEAVIVFSPLDSNGSLSRTLGICDGLFCLGFGMFDDDLCLWNPVTREYKELPASPNQSSNTMELGICGIGYDDRIDDYKVVKLYQYIRDVNAADCYPVDREDESQGMSLVDVYTMGTNSWKSIESVGYSVPTCPVAGVLVKGALHWLGDTEAPECSLVIVAFDIREERFGEIQLPEVPYEEDQIFVSVGVLEGCLCVINSVDRSHFEIWKMQDYGDRESWNFLWHIATNERIANDSCLMVVWSKNNEILFQTSGDLFFYDTEHGTVRNPSIRGRSRRLMQQELYFGSLVSLKSGTYVEPRIADEEYGEEAYA